MTFELNEDTFLIYAIKNYDNPHCSGMKEFLDDLNAFKYLKRLFKRYKNGRDLKERLILNHIIVLYNLFGPEATTQLLFYKIDKAHWPTLKTFLVYLNYLAPGTKLYDNTDETTISLDPIAVSILRKI